MFLQHGITINKGEWLFYPNTKMWRFITACKPEHEFIKEHFGYPEENIKLLGFARFDSLHGVETDKNLILVMPTWRNWLGRESRDNKDLRFEDTEYFQKWNGFLKDERLRELLTTYDKKLLFYPHRNMQKFFSFFKGSERIEIADWKKYDIQDLLKRSALMITDYSSVFFDFSYMKKPVLFYQFDESEFREKQYAEGFFDYKNTPLGKWTDNKDALLGYLEEELTKGLLPLDDSAVESVFPLWDDENCKRIYREIKGEK